ncbi:peroxide stress protein YaaA [Candidatus Marinamargulisbacteria bacterium SCGC AG-439-L15]|nr:peroxide stress protein YaaA [Candidatus Marinamargulisbacteria bacterium SCGC AG-439-L15]
MLPLTIMITLLSPSKKLHENPSVFKHSQQLPVFLDQSLDLVSILKKKSTKELEGLLHISPTLADLNWNRYQTFSKDFKVSSQALFSFSGTVYEGLDAPSFTDENILFANQHLRHLSGLFGILRPLDQIQPYRLDMGTKLTSEKGKNLYTFWGDTITQQLNADLESTSTKLVINLASNEYSKVIMPKKLNGTFLTITFKEKRKGEYKSIMSFVKFARGLMAKHIIQNQIKTADELKSFSEEGYQYNPSLSSDDTWIFSREAEK